jgi:pescadillo protein
MQGQYDPTVPLEEQETEAEALEADLADGEDGAVKEIPDGAEGMDVADSVDLQAAQRSDSTTTTDSAYQF